MKDKLLEIARIALPAAGLALAFAACAHTMKVDPVEIKPIHMTVDVNVNTNGDGTAPAGPAR